MSYIQHIAAFNDILIYTRHISSDSGAISEMQTKVSLLIPPCFSYFN